VSIKSTVARPEPVELAALAIEVPVGGVQGISS